jgi:hypothetical protein
MDVEEWDVLYPFIFNFELLYGIRKSKKERFGKKDQINDVVVYAVLIYGRRVYKRHRIAKKLSCK